MTPPTEPQVTRYDLSRDSLTDCYCGMSVDRTGDYVEYEAYAALLARAERAEADAAAAKRERDEWIKQSMHVMNTLRKDKGATANVESIFALAGLEEMIDAARAAARAGGECCVADLADCGPVTHYDADGVPLCEHCWESLCDDTENLLPNTPRTAEGA